MSKTKPSDAASEKPIPPVRIDEEFHRPLRLAMKRMNLGATRVVNQALRELLERAELWPESGQGDGTND